MSSLSAFLSLYLSSCTTSSALATPSKTKNSHHTGSLDILLALVFVFFFLFCFSSRFARPGILSTNITFKKTLKLEAKSSLDLTETEKRRKLSNLLTLRPHLRHGCSQWTNRIDMVLYGVIAVWHFSINKLLIECSDCLWYAFRFSVYFGLKISSCRIFNRLGRSIYWMCITPHVIIAVLNGFSQMYRQCIVNLCTNDNAIMIHNLNCTIIHIYMA